MTDTGKKNATPRVSVVMSVHNDAQRVDTAVRSILGQTFRDLELIVIDDGSTDATPEVLDRLAREDGHLRVIHQANTGLTGALIRGCELARGEFIARQDSDDWSHPFRIAEQVALLDADPGIGFVSCAVRYVGPGDEPLCVVSRSTDSMQATEGLLQRRQGPPAHGSVMFRAALYAQVGGYRAPFHYAQDSDLWLRMAEVARIGYLDSLRYQHRKDAGSTSGAARAAQKRFGELGHLCRQARLAGQPEAPFLDEAEALARQVKAGIAQTPAGQRRALADANYLIGAMLTANRDARARGYLWQAIRLCPWRAKPWLRLAHSLLTGRSAIATNQTMNGGSSEQDSLRDC